MSKTIDHSKRSHALLSASSAHRWLACPPSAVAQELYPAGKPSEHALEGTKAHEAAEAFARYRLFGETGDEPSNGVTQEMADYARGYADYIEEQVKDPNALVMLEQRVDFSPWVVDGFGTADCIIIQGKTMDVIDYKYGKGVEVSAVDNPQLMLYGLGAWNDYGFAYDIETVRLHIYQPRINNISVAEYPAVYLLEWAGKVKRIADLAAQGEGEYNAGMHCRWCAHAGKCKKLTEVCTQFVQHQDMTIKVPTLTPFEVAEVLEKEPLVTLWLKRVKETALGSMLHGESIPGYKVVEGKAGNRRWTDEMAVASKLLASGISDQDYIEMKLMSPSALEKSIGKKKVAELVVDFIDRSPGAPVVVPVTDKRQEYNPANNFQNLEE